MRLKLIYIVIIILVTIIHLIINVKAYEGNMKITKEKAIEIANKEAKELGYDVESMNIELTKYNTPWNKYLPKESETEYDMERRKKLTNKEYWAVYYYPKPQRNQVVKGGDICIFIDANNGDVITNIRWK